MLSDTRPTLLPIERWRALLGFHPWHFWGLANSAVPIGPGCDSLVRQYAWQGSDAAGRAEILDAIAEAERQITEYLGYSPAPRATEAIVPWPRYRDGRFARPIPADPTGRRLSVQLPEGMVRAVGVEALALTDTVTTLAGDLTITDGDSDGLLDTFTAVATVPAGTLPEQLRVCFSAVDRFDGSGPGARWFVRPVQVRISGVTATITGRAWCLVRPVLYEGWPTTAPSGGGGSAGLNPADLTVYASSLEIYARTIDPDGETLDTCQAIIRWDTRPSYLDGWCGDGAAAFPGTNASDPAAVASVVARCGVRDAAQGEVLPAHAVRNASTGVWSERWPTWWEPDRVLIRYEAGLPYADRASLQLEAEMERAIAMLAAAILARPICACADTNRQLYYYQYDLTLAGRQDELYSTADPAIQGPFGPRRGAVLAYKILTRRAQTRAYLP